MNVLHIAARAEKHTSDSFVLSRTYCTYSPLARLSLSLLPHSSGQSATGRRKHCTARGEHLDGHYTFRIGRFGYLCLEAIPYELFGWVFAGGASSLGQPKFDNVCHLFEIFTRKFTNKPHLCQFGADFVCRLDVHGAIVASL
jgi:hypothetical protein